MNNSTAILTSTKMPYSTMEITILFLFSVIMLLGVFGNGCVLHYFGFRSRKRQQSIPEFLLCTLALVDFCASVFNPMLYAYWTLTRYRWYFGYWACKFLVPLGTIATTMSGGIFCILSFDRQRSIVYPFKSHFKLRYIKISIVCVLLYAILTNAHYAFNMSLIKNKCVVQDVRDKTYSIPTITYFLLRDVFVICVIAFTNYRIFSRIFAKKVTGIVFLREMADKRRRENFRIVRILITIATVFFVLTLPRDLFQFIHIISWVNGKGMRYTPYKLHVYFFLKVMHVANCCVNPVIYYNLHAGFKAYVLEIFCCNANQTNLKKTSVDELEINSNLPSLKGKGQYV